MVWLEIIYLNPYVEIITVCKTDPPPQVLKASLGISVITVDVVTLEEAQHASQIVPPTTTDKTGNRSTIATERIQNLSKRQH